VIFISHKLNEVKAVSDRVSVLRAGRNVATVATSDATPRSLAALMIGREIETVKRASSRRREQAALELTGIEVASDRGTPAVRDVTLTVRAGEIVAIAGVSGNGQQELAEGIAGLRPLASGLVRIFGRRLRNGDPRAAIEAGVAYVPADRLGTGVAPSLTLVANASLKSYRRGSVGPLLRLGRMRARAEALIGRYDIRTPSADVPTRTLSGGNLQKLVLGRELTSDPKVLIASSPTHGLDVAAIETVHRHLLEAAAEGIAVLLISEDLDEILALNDRIVVMYEGRLSEVEDTTDLEEIGLRMAGETVVPV